VLLGTSAAGDPPRGVGRRAGNPACGLDIAGSSPSAPSFSVGGLCGSRVGKVGHLQRLRGEAAPVVRHQSGAPLLRAHPLQNVADISLTEELIAEAALGEGVARSLLGDLAYSSENLREALTSVGILFWPPSEASDGAE
jgi:hypothetical protein